LIFDTLNKNLTRSFISCSFSFYLMFLFNRFRLQYTRQWHLIIIFKHSGIPFAISSSSFNKISLASESTFTLFSFYLFLNKFVFMNLLLILKLTRVWIGHGMLFIVLSLVDGVILSASYISPSSTTFLRLKFSTL